MSALAVHAATSDDMLIYSDRLNNMSESNCNYESNQIDLIDVALLICKKVGKRRFYGRFTPMAFSHLVFTIRLFRAEWRAALDIQMDVDGSARYATEWVARLEGLHLRPLQRQVHRLLYDR